MGAVHEYERPAGYGPDGMSERWAPGRAIVDDVGCEFFRVAFARRQGSQESEQSFPSQALKAHRS